MEERQISSDVAPALRDQLRRMEALCEDLENFDSDVESLLQAKEEALKELVSLPVEFAEILSKRADAARETARARLSAAQNAAKKRQEQIETAKKLRTELDALLAAGDLVTLTEVRKLASRWEAAVTGLKAEELIQAGAEAFNAALAPLKEKLEKEEAERQAVAEAALKLADELIALTANEKIEPLQERKPGIEAEYAALGKVPKAAADKYQEAHRKAWAKLSAHFETLDLARWESYTLKLDLCKTLETLLAAADKELPAAAKKLQEIREQWKKLGAVPKEKHDEINPRYLELTRQLQHRIDEFYAALHQEQKAAAAQKKALIEEAKTLAGSTDWNAAANRFKEMQSFWKTLVRAGAQENALFTEFRSFANTFFEARSAYFAARNAKFEAVAARKKELIAAAEALGAPAGDEAAQLVRKAKQLREDYRAAGSAGRAEPELNKAFDAAMDKFFSARHAAFEEKENQAKSLISEITDLAAAITDPVGAENRFRTLTRDIEALNVRNVTRELDEASKNFRKALNSARQEFFANRFDSFRSALEKCAAKLDGAADELDLSSFPKLQNALAMAASDDPAMQKKLEKQLEQSSKEADRILSGLEALAGIEKPAADPAGAVLDLAAELQAAIIGNFGGPAAARQSVKLEDPQKLLSDFLNLGPIRAADLPEILKRFDAAYSHLKEGGVR